MLLILSARTVGEDIALEYGRLPPAFLPLGGRRLFSWQAELAEGETCVMTVPDDYVIAPVDISALEAAGILLLQQPQSFSLQQAINDALGRIRPQGAVRILYGDTLVARSDGSLPVDAIAVQDTSANYPWAFVKYDAKDRPIFSDTPPNRLEHRKVVCGYYNFGDKNLLAAACLQPTFVQALQYYADRSSLSCIEIGNWLDFGHLPLYFRSKRDTLVKRVFNELTYEDHILVKRSADTAKMRAEAHWFEHLPAPLRLHVPRYVGRIERDHQAGYGLEYLYAPLLSELSVFGALPLASWLEILRACFAFVDKCQAEHPPTGSPEAGAAFAQQFYHEVIVQKSCNRLEAFCAQSELSIDSRLTLNGIQHPPLAELTETLIACVPPTTPDQVRFWHGDLFFGNIFYDFTAQRIMCIDPRGQLGGGQLCLWGDLRYDLAKLAHSIIGHYDDILHGRSTLDVDPDDPMVWTFSVDTQPHAAEVTDIFFAYLGDADDIDVREILALTALLFLSMLPLHYESPERQRHLLAMGLTMADQVRNTT
ncbi:MAG: phosphotransferase [Chromatocurvus sp.]